MDSNAMRSISYPATIPFTITSRKAGFINASVFVSDDAYSIFC